MKLFLVVFTFSSLSIAQQTYTKLGNTIIGPNGYSTTKFHNMQFDNRGHSTLKLGDTIISSDDDKIILKDLEQDEDVQIIQQYGDDE